MVQTRLQTEETKGQDTQGNSTWRTGMVGLFAHSFVRDYWPFFIPGNVFHFYTLTGVDCTFWQFNRSANLLQK